MRNLVCLSCSVAFLLPAYAIAQDKTAATIITKAIAAHGGAKTLNKFQGAQLSGKGKVQVAGGAKFAGTFYFQMPDKVRQEFTIDINNMTIEMTQVFDGKKLWVKSQGKTIELDQKRIIQAMKEGMYAERVSSLVELHNNKEKYNLSPLGEIQVNKKPAVGVRVSSKGHKDVNLYFDKKSYLLVRMEHNQIDPMSGEETNEVKTFTKYKKVKGMAVPGHLHITRDGNEYLEMELSGFEVAEKLDDSLFARPE